ncbi:mannosyl-oligosaccharide glucosidase [Magnaporthiopsis poae ATCC 64411]|uniref:Mannosyl-oligosaccharide glucosidase n=1 Tax=Magnaporthiopsis poae (strain ATCC 64411 / 73-15) TaxID=644358 RepID=A0A0C4E1P5_MAGP6|nr:mannosyl-oligosaccharide glucosidase [Magnaporthiopsis poae ATCC 64411]
MEEMGIDGTAKSLKCQVDGTGRFSKGVCRGVDPSLGEFTIELLPDQGNSVVEHVSVMHALVPEDRIWQAKAAFANISKGRASNSSNGNGNIYFLKTVLQAPFSLDLIYSTKGSSSHITPNSLKALLDDFYHFFPQRVADVFPQSAPFHGEEYAAFTQALLSNLLGGLGFFHGDSKLDDTHAPEYDETEPKFWELAAEVMKRAKVVTAPPRSLLSHTPSRPFFPRGFLWDEGFHLIPAIEWDLDLAVSVLRSWLGLMDSDGWIGREQILGPEARSKVPAEFQVQYPHYANPQTLALLFPILLDKMKNPESYRGNPSKYLGDPDGAGKTMLRELYGLLSKHYAWFRRTQAGNFSAIYPRPEGAAASGEGYRWRGRTPQHTLTSGLDDYPPRGTRRTRPSCTSTPSPGWAPPHPARPSPAHLGEAGEAETYERHHEAVLRNLDLLHWDEGAGAYCDATVVDDGRRFERVCRLGYVSVMPLMLGLVGVNSPRLPALLDLIGDPARLWSPHGLRSLSAEDPGYGGGDDYWRGAVWANLNVLAALRLARLGRASASASTTSGTGEKEKVRIRARELGAELRQRLVETVYKSWKQTGFVWEQYSDKTGEGRRSRAFTGWTACVILLMGDVNSRAEAAGPGAGVYTDGARQLGSESGSGGFAPVVIGVVGALAAMVCLRRLLFGLWRRLADGLRTWGYVRVQRRASD